MVLIGTLWLKRDKAPEFANSFQGHEMRFLPRYLNFTEEQNLQYQTMYEEYFNTIREIRKKIFLDKKLLRTVIRNEPDNQEKIDKLAQEIGQLHTQLELESSSYFIEVRSICAKDQLVKFDNFTDSLTNKMFEQKGQMKRYRHGWRN